MKLERAENANQRLHAFADAVGKVLVDGFHYLALFAIGAAIVWSAAVAFLGMADKGHATIDDILLLALATLVIRFGSSRFPSGQSDR